MSQLLHVLIVEHSVDDAARLAQKLKQNGYSPVVKQVDTAEAMLAALEQHPWQMIIANSQLPNFSAATARKLLQERGITIPFLVVSDNPSEDTNVSKVSANAPNDASDTVSVPQTVNMEADYTAHVDGLFKESAIEVPLMQRLQEREANLSAVIENTEDAVWSIDLHYKVVVFNAVFKRQFQAAYGVELQPNLNLVECLPVELQPTWIGYYDRALRGERFVVELHYDLPNLPSDIEVSFSPIVTADQSITGVAVFGRNISDRKRAEAAMQVAKDQFQAVLDAVPGCVSWFSSDLEYLGINRYLAATFKVRPEDFIGKKLGFMESSPGFAEFVREFIVSPVKESSVEIAARVDGSDRSYLVVAQKYAHDQAAVFVGIDITDRRKFEEALRESQERYALAVQGANDGLWDWNLRTNEIYFSPRWKEMLGYDDKAIGNTPEEWFNRVHSEELEWLQAQLEAHLEGLTLHFEIEHRMLHKDGTYRWILTRGLAVRDQEQKAYRMAGSQTDITERKRAEEQLLHDALHDGLTGLSNRALFLDRLGQAIEWSKRQPDHQFAVLFLDLDRFKVVNDSLGHVVGDQLLVAIARRLQPCLRAGDTFARLGGDEFTILMEDVRDISDATRLAEQIHRELESPFNLNGQEVFTTVSIGIALSDAGCDRPEDWLRNADTAMYRAKALGRARHEIFNSAMHVKAVALLQMETDLRRAIAATDINSPSQEFQMRYQPIVNLKTGKITGFESLIRWQNPERGWVSPGEFIPVAEDTGLIIPLGQWILSQACHQLNTWHHEFPEKLPLSISVNLSTKQFSQPDLIEQISYILRETHLRQGDLKLNLKLEITESAIMENPDKATAMLKQLKELGVQLMIDDFGTGYSSLSYLQRFPFDVVKIDQSFVGRLGADGESDEIVRAIVMLAHNLGMEIVAEGVETETHMNLLRSLNAEYGQGYFFAKPLTSVEVANLLTQHPHWLVNED
ncbi:EAL domain-containing protein [Oscillatoria sp. FACHB-1407]|uniref:EAL domain-containing protein n=1 Tax=Oscillatoria sp. FACHB-1407 TaxID=2692847 RepID=UPI001683A142|nr:EAL domain-containing protein [Oscillatoria sp. FACHB-1407]MBD2463825.1 EAL domain-containing protein [Oscillatoria sp. FACHB-1407]